MNAQRHETPQPSISAHYTGSEVRLSVSGEVDANSADQLTADLQHVIATGQVTLVEVDLSALSFLDAAGITALLHARRSAAEHGVGLHVSHPHGVVQRVLEITDTLPLLRRSDPAGA